MRRVHLIVLLFFFCALLDARERISSFVSDITIKPDATLIVREDITVISEGKSILHGIVREFPTDYRDSWGTNYRVDFAVKSVEHNGNPASFWVESAYNGKKIYIGEKNIYVPRGKHTYTIIYETRRQIGFFDTHDELYWNVTGNGWRLPIEMVQARVHLPEEIGEQSITAEAYTGYQGEQGKNYHYAIDTNQVTFATNHGLKQFQGLTVVVTFPKGFVTPPSWYQKFCWFLRDNGLFILIILGILLFIILLIAGYVAAQRHNKSGTIIPLFYPPENMTPSDVGFVNKMKFDNLFLSADIVDLAVRGFITITYAPGTFFTSRSYTVTLKNSLAGLKTEKTMSAYDEELLSTLFREKESVTFSQQENSVLTKTLKICKKHTKTQSSEYVTVLNHFWYACQALIVFVACTFCLFLFLQSGDFSLLGLVMPLAFVFFFVMPFLKELFLIYTSAGRRAQDAIDGFKMYLTTAELERMKIIGTPPTRTPELYEHYLPYAIALGAEKQWTGQFSSLFADLAKQGHAYMPLWYYGPVFRIDTFGSEFTKSFSNAIVAASTPPGRSSGSGGSGRSGGGGGGGGGGGW